MKIERINEKDGRVKFGDLKGGDAFIVDDDIARDHGLPLNHVFIRRRGTEGLLVFDPTIGALWALHLTTPVTPLPDAVIRY